MTDLLLAICSSALISILMRLSNRHIQNNVSMLAVNYLTCLVTAAVLTGGEHFFPRDAALPAALGMGILHGILYLVSFVLFQHNVRKNGIVLSSLFMKLGLLVPMVVSIVIFGEVPGVYQILGFLLALGAIFLINLDGRAASASAMGLLALLVLGGTADAMSKVFEELGPVHLSEQFLLYTFATAFLLCLGLVAAKGQRFGKWEILFGTAIGIPNFFSARFLLASLESLDAVIVYPTYSVATILVITLTGTLAFREHLKKRQWAALGMILLALALLNL